MTNPEILSSIKQHLSEIDGLNDALQQNVADLQTKADKLQPLSDEYDALTQKVSATQVVLADAQTKLTAIQIAHEQFAKLVTG